MTTLAELKAEHDALAKKIAAFEVREEWPKIGGYYVAGDAEIYQMFWANSAVDLGRAEQGLIFRTSQEAEKQRQRNIVMKKLRDLAGGFAPDWDNIKQDKCLIHFDHNSKLWRSEVRNYVQAYGYVYFRTRAEAQHVIDTLGDELKVLL